MREICFRGKKFDNGEWVIGDLIQLEKEAKYWYVLPFGVSAELYEIELYKFRENDVMCEVALAKVIPETVGQYTGLTDKNGKKIFEGDVVKFNHQIGEIAFEKACFGIGTQQNIDYQNIEDDVGILSEGWNDYSGCYNDNFISLWEIYWNFDNLDCVEVIGNKYDNPELLEEQK